MRRSSNQLWAKENLLISFHLWRRYIAVYLALRRDEPVPRFTTPFISLWPALLQRMTMKNLKKNIALANADKMLRVKWWRRWKRLMTIDKALLMTPEELAIRHYQLLKMKSHIRAWHGILAERGDIMRIRDKAFAAWKAWAPMTRRLAQLHQEVLDWQVLCDKAKVYRAMTTYCRAIIERRIQTLSRMRLVLSDRRVLICAFALAGREAHVAFLDCWRRWRKWIELRHSWRFAAREFRFSYQVS